LGLFADKHFSAKCSIEEDIQVHRLLLLARVDGFTDYMKSLIDELIEFCAKLGISLQASSNFSLFTSKISQVDIMRFAFSFVISQFSFQEFSTVARVSKDDTLLEKSYSRIASGFLKEKSSSELMTIFRQPGCLAIPEELLKTKLFYGGPIEKVNIIVTVVECIRVIYKFETGNECTDDGLKSLLAFILIRAKIPGIIFVSL